MRRAVPVAVGILATVAVLLGLIVGGIPHFVAAAFREPAAREAWEREFGDPEMTLARYPKQSNDSIAIRLIQLVRPLGAEMVTQPGRRRLIEPAGDRVLSGAFADYIWSELTRTVGVVQSPPELVSAFLETCRTNVDEIVRFLSVSGPPAWDADVRLGSEAPGPDPVSQMLLQRVLIANALDLACRGEARAAEESLRSSWTLNASLRYRPDVLSQIIAVSVARMQVGLVRRISVDPAIWQARLADHDYRASLLRALEVESLGTLETLPTGGSIGDRASRADFLDVKRAFLVLLRNSRVSDRPIEDSRNQKELEARTLGGIVERMSETNVPQVLERVHRLIFDAELSELVLEARALRAGLGQWPSSLADVTRSRFQGGRWSYSVDRVHRMTISFSPEPHWENLSGKLLPVRYQSE